MKNDAPDNATWLMSFGNTYLRFTIFVTEQCNFRCTYCYEDFKLGKIETDVVEGLKNLILARIPELKVLKLSFFGGEPLMNKPVVLELSRWAQELCQQHNVEYIGDITTNGYALDSDTFAALCDAGVRSYQITLDGEKETHDKLRPTLNGKPTFDKILGNITGMVKSKLQFSCTIRLNVADYNFDSVKSLVDHQLALFTGDPRFAFHIHPIFGMEDLHLSRHEAVEEFKQYVSSMGLHYHDGGETSAEELVCYAARADSYVIRADGAVQKCTVALKSDINTIGRLHKDGTLELDQWKLKKWVFAENKMCPVLSLQQEKLLVAYDDAGKYTEIQESAESV